METMPESAPAEEIPPYREHQGAHRQYVRDIILGVNDGLVSIFLLVAGVVGGGLSSQAVLLTAVAGAIAGAVSMAAGEFVATKSQEEVFEGEMELEREHLKYHRERELDELREWFGDMSLEPPMVERIVSALDEDDESLMKIMMAMEFGVVEEERRSPYTAMIMSGVLFLIGSMPSLLPFVFDPSPTTGLVWAAVLSSMGLFTVGALKTLVTRGNPWRSGTENLVIGMAGAVVSFGVGSLFDVAA